MPNNERVFSRGFSSISTGSAVESKLVQENHSSRGATNSYAPGLFFSAGKDSLRAAENWAVMIALREGKTAHTMQLRVTQDNFPSIAGKMCSVDMTSERGRRGYKYRAIEDFNKLYEVVSVIQLWSLDYQDLVALNCIVGYGSKVGEFEYATYEDLFKKYIQA